MASYRIEFNSSAERDLRRLNPKVMPNIARRIDALGENPFPRQSRKLAGAEEAYRLRVGVYRVIYTVDQGAETVVVQYVRHRREAYRRL